MVSHVTSLEISKELAKVLPEGYESEHIYTRYRVKLISGGWGAWSEAKLIPYEKYISTTPLVEREVYPALLLTEVLELLPLELDYDGGCEVYLDHSPIDECFYYEKSYGKNLSPFFYYDKCTQATAVARLALWLVENGYELEGK